MKGPSIAATLPRAPRRSHPLRAIGRRLFRHAYGADDEQESEGLTGGSVGSMDYTSPGTPAGRLVTAATYARNSGR